MAHFRIIVEESVDDQFVERYFRVDPFDYFNRCIAEGIGYDKIELSEPGVHKEPDGVQIQIHKYTSEERQRSSYVGMTHKVQYDFNVSEYGNHGNGAMIFKSLMCYFSPLRILHVQKLKGRL